MYTYINTRNIICHFRIAFPYLEEDEVCTYTKLYIFIPDTTFAQQGSQQSRAHITNNYLKSHLYTSFRVINYLFTKLPKNLIYVLAV